jgi:Rrf2 family protein
VKIARHTVYAVRVMVHLTGQPPHGRVSTATISDAEHIPRAFLSKVISKLAVARLVTTSRGMGGGVSLVRLPEEITFLDVIEAMEGPVLLHHCLRQPGTCELHPYRASCDVWRDIQARLIQDLDAVTIRELSSRHTEMKGI